MTFWVTCFTHIWPINHLASHLTPGSLVRTSTHGWDSTDISHTLNRVPTSVHTLPSHEHLGNHPEDWLPSITSGIVTDTVRSRIYSCIIHEDTNLHSSTQPTSQCRRLWTMEYCLNTFFPVLTVLCKYHINLLQWWQWGFLFYAMHFCFAIIF